jgi:hypothetical protein
MTERSAVMPPGSGYDDAGRIVNARGEPYKVEPRMWYERLGDLGSMMLPTWGGLAAASEVAIGEAVLGSRRMRAPAAGASSETLASRSASMYDPPAKPPRPFEADYPRERWPDGPPADATGRLTHDIDGRPLDRSALVVGRRVVGGEDQALTAAQLDAVPEKITGRIPEAVSPGHARRSEFDRIGYLGLTTVDKETGYPTGVLLHGDMDAASARSVTGHETGHVVQHAASPGGLPVDAANITQEAQLRRIYNDLNNPDPRHRGIPAWVSPRKPLPANVVSPETRGYHPHQVDSELWAEAIRAYMADPNYIKTVAPDVAAAIRKVVNENPRLRKIIQFNALVPPGAVKPVASELFAPKDERSRDE